LNANNFKIVHAILNPKWCRIRSQIFLRC